MLCMGIIKRAGEWFIYNEFGKAIRNDYKIKKHPKIFFRVFMMVYDAISICS